MNNIKEYNNLIAFHPGSYIEDIIDDLNITQKEYAQKLGVTEKTLSKLVNGKANLTPEVASKLSLATGISIQSWLNLQSKYEEKILEIENQKKFDINKKIVKCIDYDYFKKHNMVENIRTNIRDKIKNICQILSISDLQYLNKLPEGVSYRNTSQKFDDKVIINSNIMLELASMKASKINAPKYNEEKLKELLSMIREWTLLPPDEYYNKLLDGLRDCGIILVVLPHLRNAGINGAVKRLNSGSILLMLNDKGKGADIFWFSLAHELAHILKSEYEVNLVGDSLKSNIERSADEFAKDILIDRDNYDNFVKMNNFTENSVKKFAEENKVHPGIVVGRLQNDKLIGYDQLYNLKSRIKIDL